MSESPFTLAGRVALVTGAGSGIGRATAQMLDSLGATVVATDINNDTCQETVDAFKHSGGNALAHDVTAEADWHRVIEHVSDNHGRLDILVNNAGIMISSPFVDTPIEMYRKQHQINVESVYMGMQLAAPLMQATLAERDVTSCAIVNVSSIFGQIVGDSFSAYSATKGAVRMLSKAVANELAPVGIRVNTVHPGPTQTNLTASWEQPLAPDGKPLTAEQIAAMWEPLIPMGRVGEVSDISSVIAFLASDAAKYITGAEIVIDGGFSIR